MAIYYGERDTCNFESNKYIQINSCGITSTGGTEYRVIRERGRVDYHLLYVTKGAVKVRYELEEHTLSAGDFVIYPPHSPQWYERSRESCDRWIHFNGFQVEEILADAKIGPGVFGCRFSNEIKAIFDRITPRTDAKRANCYDFETGHLVSLLYALGNTLAGNSTELDSRISDCIAFINDNYSSCLSIAQLSAVCNLSESRFLALFKQELGISPISYLQNLRMEQAKHLLMSTSLAVSEISASVGYDDPLYFSKLFKSHFGISPKAYRENY